MGHRRSGAGAVEAEEGSESGRGDASISSMCFSHVSDVSRQWRTVAFGTRATFVWSQIKETFL